MIEFMKLDFEFDDDRGALKQLCHNGWKQVNVSKTIAGVERGGHFHKNSNEAFYIITGEIDITLKDKEKTQNIIVKDNDFFVIKPNVKHYFKFLKDTLMVIMYDIPIEKDDGTKDIFPANDEVQNA